MEKVYTFLLLLWISSSAVAQVNKKQLTAQSQVWARYYPKIILGNHWEMHAEIEDRRFIFPGRQHQLLLPRLHVHYLLGKSFDFGAGFSYFLQSLPADPEKEIDIVRPEWRPHQEVTYKTREGRLGISHRYRLEERYLRKMADNKLTDGYDFNFRARYQLQLQYPLISKDAKKGALDLRLYDEIMLNLGNSIVYNTFDQNRLGVALNYGILENLQLQLDFLHWFQQKSSGKDYSSLYISRFTLYHTLNPKR